MAKGPVVVLPPAPPPPPPPPPPNCPVTTIGSVTGPASHPELAWSYFTSIKDTLFPNLATLPGEPGDSHQDGGRLYNRSPGKTLVRRVCTTTESETTLMCMYSQLWPHPGASAAVTQFYAHWPHTHTNTHTTPVQSNVSMSSWSD